MFYDPAPNGLRYLRWGGDGEAVQPEKGSGVGNCLRLPQNPQRQVHALLGSFHFTRHYGVGVCDGIGVRGQPPVIP